MSCELEKVIPENLNLIDQKLVMPEHFKIPFFSIYKMYSSYSGKKWMTVYKLPNNTDEPVYYIRQYQTPINECKTVDANGTETTSYSSCDTVFLPQLWNTQLQNVSNDGFIDKGVITIYSETFEKINDNDLNEYNNSKIYSIHGGDEQSGELSDGQKIPDALMNYITKPQRLFVTFKWSVVGKGEIANADKTFYGIYDFINPKNDSSMWKKTIKSENQKPLVDEENNVWTCACGEFLNPYLIDEESRVIIDNDEHKSGTVTKIANDNYEVKMDKNNEVKMDKNNDTQNVKLNRLTQICKDCAKSINDTTKINTQMHEVNFQYNTDFEEQFPQTNEVTEDDKTKICELMQQFMDKVKPQATNVAAGGGADIDEIYNHLIKDDSVKKLGQYKMVATFNTYVVKDNPDKAILQKIVKLSELELTTLEEKVNKWFSEDIKFKIYVGDKNNPTTMNTIFYSNKYLEQLVETINDLDRTTTRSVTTILKYCSTQQSPKTLEFDLVNIVFNYMGQKRDEFTPEGSAILENYEHDNFDYGKKYYDKDNSSTSSSTSSSDVAGGGADTIMIDDPNYLKKGGERAEETTTKIKKAVSFKSDDVSVSDPPHSKTGGDAVVVSVANKTPIVNPKKPSGPSRNKLNISPSVTNPSSITGSLNPGSNPVPTTVPNPDITTVLNPSATSSSSSVSTTIKLKPLFISTTPGSTPVLNPDTTTVLNPGPPPSATSGSSSVPPSGSTTIKKSIIRNPLIVSKKNPGSPTSAITVSKFIPPPISEPTKKEILKEINLQPSEIPKLDSGKEIHIEIKFDNNNIPDTIEIINSVPTSVEPSLNNYIKGLCDGSIDASNQTKYFKLNKNEINALLKVIADYK